MDDEAATATDDESTVTEEETNTETSADDDQPEGAEDLGDKGKRALDAMKAQWKEEKAKRRALEAQIAEAATPKPKDNTDVDAIRAQVEREATAKANSRLVRAEVRAAATGKLSDPKDALSFLDMSQFEVDENGDVDTDEINDAIDDLLITKPYLAAATAKRFQDSGDGGAARKASKPAQLTRDDLAGMSAEQIMKAKKEGRMSNLLSGK